MHAAEQDYEGFYQEEILYRELSGYPPAAHMLAVQIYAKVEEAGKELAEKLANVVKSIAETDKQTGGKLLVVGPAPAAIGKINDIFRFVFYVKYQNYDKLVQVKDVLEEKLQLWQPKQETVQFDFDPMNTF